MSSAVVPVAALPARRSSSAFARFRLPEWRLSVKLAMVALVPVTTAMALGLLVISDDLGRANEFRRIDHIVEIAGTVREGIAALQAERQRVAAPDITASDGESAVELGRRVDASVAASARAVDAYSADRGDPAINTAWSGVGQLMARLPAIRSGRDAMAADPQTRLTAYTQLVDALLAFDRVLTAELPDAQMARASMGLYDLVAAREEVLYQQAVVLDGIGRGAMTVPEITSLHGSVARMMSGISDFRVVADPVAVRDLDGTLAGSALVTQSALLARAIQESGGPTGQMTAGTIVKLPPATWNDASRAVADALSGVADGVAGQVQAAAVSARQQAIHQAVVAAALLVTAMLIAGVVTTLMARQLIGSLRVLRRAARDVATRQLPSAVERIRTGESVDIAVEPVPLHTSDEVGQVARAFDAVHAEALKLAREQANLRGTYNALFVNLSRRSQSLVRRQLRLIEQLERDEEDPDQLAALFKLDHLATRMRRNNENLIFLSGGELSRGQGQPLLLADLLRAAVSEIEQYQRVVVAPPPTVSVVGYAASDLVRLLAELLDNATAFSAPETQVAIASHQSHGRAVVVDIVDHGVGMTDADLTTANERIARAAGFVDGASSRMGLFVVSRLAVRHGVLVRLHGGDGIPGLRVTVTVPPELLVSEPPPQPIDATPHPDADQPRPATVVPEAAVPPPTAASSDVDLFTPLDEDEYDTGEATASPDAEDQQRDRTPDWDPEETTPIYDDMVSAWFHDAAIAEDSDDAVAAAPAATPEADGVAPVPSVDAGAPAPHDWRFAADVGWQAAGELDRWASIEHTAAGLPKRRPRARLLPGSVAERPPVRPSGISPERVRDRLAGFHRGVRRGRQETGAMPVDGEVESSQVVGAPLADQAVDTAIWTSGPDTGWLAFAEVTEDEPAAITEAGLPKRQPGACRSAQRWATEEGTAVSHGCHALDA